MSINEKLKAARKAIGLTQKEVELQTGFKANTVSNWEQGVSNPDVDSIIVLCKLYNVMPNHLFDWGDFGFKDPILHEDILSIKLQQIGFEAIGNGDEILLKYPDGYNIRVDWDDLKELDGKTAEYLIGLLLKLKVDNEQKKSLMRERKEPIHLMPNAAHNEFADDKEEQKLMQEDLDEL
jgi:transcriptional regulator with XRE-family HTH domain